MTEKISTNYWDGLKKKCLWYVSKEDRNDVKTLNQWHAAGYTVDDIYGSGKDLWQGAKYYRYYHISEVRLMTPEEVEELKNEKREHARLKRKEAARKQAEYIKSLEEQIINLEIINKHLMSSLDEKE